MDKTQLLKEKTLCIGGSDAHHLFNMPPFGCERRLWYDKRGVSADFPFSGNIHTERGEYLEDVAARFYAKRTGRAVMSPVPGLSDFVLNHDHPLIGSHPDRYQSAEGKPGLGVLQIKCPSIRSYYRVKGDGLPAYVGLQAQWDACAAGQTWGTSAFFNAEVMDVLHFDFDVDEGMEAGFAAVADSFWATLDAADNPYDRLEDGDKRCSSCPWRTKCKGLGAVPDVIMAEVGEVPEKEFVFDPTYDERIAQYIAMRDDFREQEKAFKKFADELKKDLADRRVECGSGRAWVQTVHKKAYEVKAQTQRSIKVYAPQFQDSEEEL